MHRLRHLGLPLRLPFLLSLRLQHHCWLQQVALQARLRLQLLRMAPLQQLLDPSHCACAGWGLLAVRLQQCCPKHRQHLLCFRRSGLAWSSGFSACCALSSVEALLTHWPLKLCHPQPLLPLLARLRCPADDCRQQSRWQASRWVVGLAAQQAGSGATSLLLPPRLPVRRGCELSCQTCCHAVDRGELLLRLAVMPCCRP